MYQVQDSTRGVSRIKGFVQGRYGQTKVYSEYVAIFICMIELIALSPSVYGQQTSSVAFLKNREVWLITISK